MKKSDKQELPQFGTKEFNDLASQYFGGKPKEKTIEEIVEKLSIQDAKKLDTFLNGMRYQEKIKQEDYALLKIELSHTKTLLESCEKALEERDRQEQEKNKYSEEDIINALHSVELNDNKDYSKIYEGMKEWFKKKIKIINKIVASYYLIAYI